MGIVRGSVAAGAVLAAAFIWGFAAEIASVFGEPWLVVLAVFGPMVVLLTAALAASVGEKVTLPTAVTAVIVGLLVGGLMGITFVLGAISPFALELGERDLNDLGGDIGLDVSLTIGLIFWGAGGAVVGAACGTAAWALRFAVRQMRSAHGRETREAVG